MSPADPQSRGPLRQHAPPDPAGDDRTAAMSAGEQDTWKNGASRTTLAFLKPSNHAEHLGAIQGRVGDYEVLEVLGRGGMGVVLRAVDRKLNRQVAVKVLSHDLAADPSAVKRFLREAQAAAAVHHDHVVTIHAVDDQHDPPFLVMQMIDGETLQQKLDRERVLPVPTAVNVGIALAEGLAAAHRQGLIHRDVKPGNVLLERATGKVRLTDFGLARAGNDSEITQTGVIVGTPYYMSPEQARGRTLDPRSDLFSLGGVLYAMCTGKLPFAADSALAVLHRVCEESPEPVGRVNPAVPAWLDAVIQRLLEKDPDRRFPSAAEVAEALRAGLALGEHATVPLRPAIDTTVTPMPRQQRPKRVRRGVILGGGLLVALGLLEVLGITPFTEIILRAVWGEGVIVVQVDDPAIRVTIDDREVVITQPDSQEVRVRAGQHTVRATRRGKAVPVEPSQLTLSRGGREVVRIRIEPLPVNPLPRPQVVAAPAVPSPLQPDQPPAAAPDATAGPRNPFGQADVFDPDGQDVADFAKRAKLPGGDDDPNATPWAKFMADAVAGSIDGQWESRWHAGEEAWVVAAAQIKSVGERVYVLLGDGDYLLDARRVAPDLLVGRYQNLHADGDTAPWVGRIISHERIDGYWENGSDPPAARWDFRRRLKPATPQPE